MKKSIIILSCLIALLLTGCKANMPVAQQSGKEDVAYLLFVSQSGEYKSKTVQVDIDGNKYNAEVVKLKNSNRRGTQYSCPTGTHTLKVTYEGRILYNKKVFLSTQQIKNITLP